MCHMSCVTCQLSHVMYHMSGVMCQVSQNFFFFFWKVVELVGGGDCYQGGLPRLVFCSSLRSKKVVFLWCLGFCHPPPNTLNIPPSQKKSSSRYLYFVGHPLQKCPNSSPKVSLQVFTWLNPSPLYICLTYWWSKLMEGLLSRGHLFLFFFFFLFWVDLGELFWRDKDKDQLYHALPN